ncbi:MAG: hypothetical protein Q7S22_04070 [Candidatus Micrarchaeota archaeon]|nr:hypothetical protein [Candidatus Micrarchaeota archaeon]
MLHKQPSRLRAVTIVTLVVALSACAHAKPQSLELAIMPPSKGCIKAKESGIEHARITSPKQSMLPRLTYSCEDGKLSGEQIVYHSNGNVKVRQTYVNGKLNGEVLRFDNQGNLNLRQFYVGGRMEGLAVAYHKDGKVSRVTIYQPHDKRSDVQEQYFTASWDKYGNLTMFAISHPKTSKHPVTEIPKICIVNRDGSIVFPSDHSSTVKLLRPGDSEYVFIMAKVAELRNAADKFKVDNPQFKYYN